MEKISIVRRRLETPPTRAEIRARERMDHASSEPGPTVRLPAMGPAAGQPDQAVNVDLSPQVLDEIWSEGYVGEGSAGQRHFIVEAEKERDSGSIVLKLQFMKPDYYLRLLTTEEVCEMLHISRSTLYGYARRGALKTYRMGRGLRFRFQDVLDFLAGCESGRN